MATKLTNIYSIVTKKAGFKGRLRLAIRTGCSLKKARMSEDNPELVTKFIESASSILGFDIRNLIMEVDNARY